jgi:hypothetical protein
MKMTKLDTGAVHALGDLILENKIDSLHLLNASGMCIIGEYFAERLAKNTSLRKLVIELAPVPPDLATGLNPNPIIEFEYVLPAALKNEKLDFDIVGYTRDNISKDGEILTKKTI